MTPPAMKTPCNRSDCFTIGVLGSYGGLNIGDEAILECVLGSLRELRPYARAVVFSRNPEWTRQQYPDISEVVAWEGVGRNEMCEVLSRLDLLVLGGGSILFDGDAQRYLRVVEAARRRGVPVFLTCWCGRGSRSVSGVPFLPLPYAGKVFDFAQATGAPALRGVACAQTGLLLAEVDRLWDEHVEWLPRLRERVRELQQQAHTTCRRCETLLDALPPLSGVLPPPRLIGQ